MSHQSRLSDIAHRRHGVFHSVCIRYGKSLGEKSPHAVLFRGQDTECGMSQGSALPYLAHAIPRRRPCLKRSIDLPKPFAGGGIPLSDTRYQHSGSRYLMVARNIQQASAILILS